MINILIADDHQIFRDGLKALLSKVEDFRIAGEAANGREVIDFLEKNEVDVVIMDINMPVMNGIEATEHISQQVTGPKVLALSMNEDEQYIMKMLQVGAMGYVLKNTGRQELINAINTLARGDSYFSKEVSDKLLNRFISPKNTRPGSSSNYTKEVHLTKREIEVLRLIAEELTNPEIAERLSISRRTVDTHRKNLLHKLGAKNTVGLVKYALANGIVGEE